MKFLKRLTVAMAMIYGLNAILLFMPMIAIIDSFVSPEYKDAAIMTGFLPYALNAVGAVIYHRKYIWKSISTSWIGLYP